MKGKYPVIFLDRDGVLTKEKGYVTTLEELEIFSYAQRAVQSMHQLGYKVIVITNQSAVARNLMTEEGLNKIHEHLKKETCVDDIYYCPHYPPKGQEILPYQIECKCRKPGIGLVESAIEEHDLTLHGGFFVGDRATDLLTGQKINVKTVLLESGYGSKNLEMQVVPDYKFEDLLEFVQFLYKIKL